MKETCVKAIASGGVASCRSVASSRGVRLVNLDNISGNIKAIKNLVKPGTMVMAVVKADAYGHGIIAVSKTAIEAGAQWLGCATVHEGMTLRRNGIKSPILILSPVFPEEYENLVAHDLVASVFSVETCAGISACAARLGKKAAVHIKIDTGMNRIGFDCTDTQTVLDDVSMIFNIPNIDVSGIYSHFAAADCDPGFTQEQFSRFQKIADAMEERGLKIPIRHISNSAGVLNHPECSLDMVRCGAIVYALAPDSLPESAKRLQHLGFRQAMTLKSRVSRVKTVKKGESVGYGRSYTAAQDMRVASVPLGYADGLSRKLSGKGRVLVNGRFCGIVGNICMDQFMADVTGMTVKTGDEVVVIGESGGQCISFEDVARLQGTINYEIATSLSLRLPVGYAWAKR